MSKGKKRAQSAVSLRLHPTALQELSILDEQTRADVAVIFDRVNGKTHQEILGLLDERSDSKVSQYERGTKAGPLRVVFAWGPGVLWFIGAYVKTNNADGERFIKRILPRAKEVKNVGPVNK